MAKVIVISGPHRSGKTTVAKALAGDFDEFLGSADNYIHSRANIEFVPSNVGALLQELGFTAKQDLNTTERANLQFAIANYLYDFVHDLSKRKGDKIYVTDRGPLDAYIYLLSEVNRTVLNQYAGVVNYQTLMLQKLKAKFEQSLEFSEVYIAAALPYNANANSSTSAQNHEYYIKHLDLMFRGIAQDYNLGVLHPDFHTRYAALVSKCGPVLHYSVCRGEDSVNFCEGVFITRKEADDFCKSLETEGLHVKAT